VFIKRIRFRGFGKLNGSCEFVPGKCNVLCQENEYGKSTLVDAILFSFYNFPATGMRRGELKPKQKYRPWDTGGHDAFETEMDLVLDDGSNLRLTSRFQRQQPFELVNLDTGRSEPLDGVPFGRRFFGMPLQSFTDCFFLRQDDSGPGSRDDLVEIIETAATSNQRIQDSSIRKALGALADCRVCLDEFSAGPITPDTLIARIDEKLGATQDQLAAMERRRAQRAAEISAAEELDAEIERLRRRQALLECAASSAEISEIEALLRRQQELEVASQGKLARMKQLEPYARFDPALRPLVQELYSAWCSLRDQAEHSRSHAGTRVDEPLRMAERELSVFPPSMGKLTPNDLDRLRSLKLMFNEQLRDISVQSRKVASTKEEMTGQGVPVEEFEALRKRTDTMPAADIRVLLEHEHQRTGLQAAVAEAEKCVAEASARAATARARREKSGTYSGVMFVCAIVAFGVGLLFLLLKYAPLGAALSLLAAAFGAAGIWHVHRAHRLDSTELEPALSAEISKTSEVRKLRDQIETLEGNYRDALARSRLQEGEIRVYSHFSEWAQMLSTYHAAEEYHNRIMTSHGETRAQICEIVRAVVSDPTPDLLNEAMIDNCIRQAERFLETHSEMERLKTESAALKNDLRLLGQRRDEKLAELENILRNAGADGVSLDDRISSFLDGCDKAARYHELQREAHDAEVVAPAAAEQLRERADFLRARLHELRGRDSVLAAATLPAGTRASLQAELELASGQREELRVQRINAFNECDRDVEEWRKDGPRLRAEIARLKDLRTYAADFRDSAQIAHRELAAIADEVFTQWAAALNNRVNEILPALAPGYRDIQISDDLELTLHSDSARRRLGAREIAHLSRGTRDQLALVLRIAVCEYLSAHVGNLPLVFDEPFAHWDDGRFADGTRCLAAMAERHQVILLSCHNWRYRELERVAPDLAARLNFCAIEP
jgi:DNA repair exonuclease SbcCD ATPase subunit